MQLTTLFNPHSVALIGITPDPEHGGYQIAQHVLRGKGRDVHFVSTTESELCDQKTFPTVADIPVPVDLAIIAVPAADVARTLRECADKGVLAVIVISVGFTELGDAGIVLLEELATIAREKGIALLGPQCVGVVNTRAAWNASLAGETLRTGSVSFISRSGSLGTTLLDRAMRAGVGFSHFVSIGAGAIVSEADVLEYLATDRTTRSVIMYLEQVTDGPALLAAIRHTVKNKPVVILRAGKNDTTELSSLVDSDDVLDAALAQAGALLVDTDRALFAFALLFGLGYTEPLAQLMLVSTEGLAAHTIDLIADTHSLSRARLSEETEGALRKIRTVPTDVQNPLTLEMGITAEELHDVLELLIRAAGVDVVLLFLTPQIGTPDELVALVQNVRDTKPVIPIYMGADAAPDMAGFIEAGIPVFNSLADVIEVLDVLSDGREKIAAAGADEPVTRLSSHLEMYPIEDMRTILENYDMPLHGVLVTEKTELSRTITKLGDGPYVLKAVSAQLVHKHDLGAVLLDLPDQTALEKAWDVIVKKVEKHTPGATIDGMLVQNMISGIACSVSMVRDPVVGASIVFGLGSTLAAVLDDRAVRVLPVTKTEVREMIEEIKGYPLLAGANDTAPVKIDALADLLTSLSHLAIDYPEIQEVDFDPVYVTPKGMYIVDARVMREKRVETLDPASEA